MAQLIADDWKAIHDRMEQIEAERRDGQPVCHRCGDTGWLSDRPRIREITYRICDACRNPKGLPIPSARGQSSFSRA